MATFRIPATDGVYTKELARYGDIHTLSVNTAIGSGALTVEAAYPGTDVFQPVPRGVVDLTDPRPFRFTGPVGQYRFTVSGAPGSGEILVTDSGGESAMQGYGYNYGELFPEGVFNGLRALTVQPYTEANVKNGLQFYIRMGWPTADPIGAGTTRYVRAQTGSKAVIFKDRVLHYIGEEVQVQLYEGPIWSGAVGGVSRDPSNYSRSDNAQVSTMTWTKNVNAPNTKGTPFDDEPEYLFGTTASGQRTPFSIPSGRERILKPNTDFLIELVVPSGVASARVQYFGDWYEGDPDIPLDE